MNEKYPYFPVFGLNKEIYSVNSVLSLNTGKYGPVNPPYLDTFNTVQRKNTKN